MSTSRAVWSPPQVAKVKSSEENCISMMALACGQNFKIFPIMSGLLGSMSHTPPLSVPAATRLLVLQAAVQKGKFPAGNFELSRDLE